MKSGAPADLSSGGICHNLCVVIAAIHTIALDLPSFPALHPTLWRADIMTPQ